MPDFDRAEQILAIAQILSRVPTGNPSSPMGEYMQTPPPIRGMWATELHDKFGVRVHPELAKAELVRVQTKAGNFGPVQEVTRNTPAPAAGAAAGGPDVSRLKDAQKLLLDWMRAQGEVDPNLPKLADRIQRAQGKPQDAALLLAEIQRDYPEVWDKGQDLVNSMGPL